ncbi:peptidase domain-containing ABC transporter [Cohnella caldifontis]|uniref:peptidase domain-containing ABC transporter n=1 Tax=Cohnella caldifontis TaxID=3027471 RepID=UPI0023EC30A5|nr:peptidase domain-containing ABC transporter [Cohnella sp. YIM B05605]
MESIIRTLNRVALFDLLSDAQKRKAAGLFEPAAFRMGETIAARGEAVDAFYIIESGQARWIGLNGAGEETSLSVLRAGEFFGEQLLFGESPAEATVAASTPLRTLRLTKPGFAALLREYPALEKYFREMLANEGMRLFLKHSTVLSGLDSEAIRSLLDRFEARDYEAGDVLVREGAEGDAFYIIRSGAVTVEIGEERKIVNRLLPGDFFGELALLTGEPRKATVRAAERTAVFRLDKAEFDRLTAVHPLLKQSLQQTAAGYSQEALVMPDDLEDPEISEQPGQAELPTPKRGEGAMPGRFRRKYAVLRQQSEMDCGPTCLAMICRHYGVEVSLNRMRERMRVSQEGVSLAVLAAAAEEIGFAAAARQIGGKVPEKAALPAIFHWDGEHYVVVYAKRGRRYLIADPRLGVLDSIPEDELKRHWNGIALELSPTAELRQPRGEGKETLLKRFLPFLKPVKGAMLDVFLLSIAIEGILLALPILSQLVIDRVIAYRDPSMLRVLLIGMLVLALFQMFYAFMRRYLVAATAAKLDIALVESFNKKLFGLPFDFFLRRTIGDIMTRVGENENIRRMLTGNAVYFLLDLLAIVMYGVLMLAYNAKLALIGLAFMPAFVVLILTAMPILRKIDRKLLAAESDTHSKMVEAVQAVATVKALAIEKIVRAGIRDKLVKERELRKQGTLLAAGVDAFSALVEISARIAMLYWGTTFVLRGELTIGGMVAFLSLFHTVMSAVISVTDMLDGFSEARVSMERLNDVLGARDEQPNPRQKRILPPIRGHIEFRNVTFRYAPGNPNVLQNLNLEIHPGQTVAIVGRSGAGKTTFIQLLLALFEPTEGRIRIDGFDLRNVHYASLRRQIGVVQQENVIFSATVRENIAIHQPDASFEEVAAAAKLAGADEFISALTLGYETKIGEGGTRLSGGQRQRIAIARALLGHPRLLVFDEATSALDAETERHIQRNMDAILSERTAIVIAHRLSTVRRADRIVVLDRGTIAESGTHEELMSLQGLYFHMVSEQMN